MVNTIKLKRKIKEFGLTQKLISSEIGISLVSVNKKINGKTSMTLKEAEGIAKMLHIKNSDFNEYFFWDACCSMQQL